MRKISTIGGDEVTLLDDMFVNDGVTLSILKTFGNIDPQKIFGVNLIFREYTLDANMNLT